MMVSGKSMIKECSSPGGLCPGLLREQLTSANPGHMAKH